MNYALGYAFSAQDLFLSFNMKRLTMKWATAKKYKCDTKYDLMVRIFVKAVELIIKDIITNNIIFELPTGPRPSNIRVTPISGEDFVQARLNGKFSDVDIIDSNFTGHQLTLTMYGKDYSYIRTKNIYLNPELKKIITDNTNKGMVYN